MAYWSDLCFEDCRRSKYQPHRTVQCAASDRPMFLGLRNIIKLRLKLRN